jgi:hypothetical protein
MFAITRFIDRPWTHLSPRRIGGVPSGLGTPDRFILIGPDDAPRLRIDLYFPSDIPAFRVDARVLDAAVVIGFGDQVDIVPFSDAPVETQRLDSYFMRFYEGDGYLLATSGADVTRINADGTIAWQSAMLAMDGVVIDRIADGVIHGWAGIDPPDGWQPFAIAVTTGATLQ